jgi:hypothetical protein
VSATSIPAATERQVFRCQTPGCGQALGNYTLAQARATGWRIYDGPSAVGTPLKVCLCADCCGGIVESQRDFLPS